MTCTRCGPGERINGRCLHEARAVMCKACGANPPAAEGLCAPCLADRLAPPAPKARRRRREEYRAEGQWPAGMNPWQRPDRGPGRVRRWKAGPPIPADAAARRDWQAPPPAVPDEVP